MQKIVHIWHQSESAVSQIIKTEIVDRQIIKKRCPVSFRQVTQKLALTNVDTQIWEIWKAVISQYYHKTLQTSVTNGATGLNK